MENRQIKSTYYFMLQALKEARKAQEMQEVPIGAVIVRDSKIISRGFNKSIVLSDPTAHAEIVALQKAAKKLKNYRLNDCNIYVTIEPCIMCIGALLNARIKKIIFGAFDKKSGACVSVFRIADNKKLNHRIEIAGGEKEHLNTACSYIVQTFFKNIRFQKKQFKKKQNTLGIY